MAELSSQFAAISPGMDVSTAQSGLVSVMKAFDVSTEKVKEDIISKINYLGNHFAETNEDIIQGLMRSSAAFAAIGGTFEENAALFSGGMEILQNAEKMGTALRSFSLRIRGYSENSVDGEEEIDEGLKNITGDLIDLTKTAQHAQGISIFKEGSTTEFKSMVEYLGEVADIWDEMSDVQKNSFLQKAFAKTQAQAGSAIITNFDQVRNALTAMENSAGSADAEMSVVQDSIEFKLNALKESWVGFLQGMVDRGTTGDVIEFLTDVSGLLQGIVDILANIPTASGVLAGVLSLKNNAGFVQSFMNRNAQSDIVQESMAAGFSPTIGSGGKILVSKEQMNVMKGYNAVMNASSETYDDFINKNGKAMMDLEKMGITAGETGYAWQQYTTKTKLAAVATKALATAGNILISVLASIAITKVIEACHEYSNEIQNAADVTEDFSQKHKQNQETLASASSSLKDLEGEYQTLAKGVSESGKNLSLTTSEYQRYKEIVGKISDALPTLNKVMNDNGEVIGFQKGQLHDLNQEMVEYKKTLAKQNLTKKDENGNVVNVVDEVSKNYTYKSNDGGTNAEEGGLLHQMWNKAKLMFSVSNPSDETIDIIASTRDIFDEFNRLLNMESDEITKWLDTTEDGFWKKDFSEQSFNNWIKNQLGITDEQMQSDDFDWTALKQKIASLKQQYKDILDSSAKSIGETMSDIAISSSNLDATGQNLIESLFGNMSDDDIQTVLNGDTTSANIGKVAKNIVDTYLSHKSEVDDAFNELMSLDISNMPVEQAQQVINEYIEKIMSILPVSRDMLMNNTGFGSFFDDILPQYNNAVSLGSGKFHDDRGFGVSTTLGTEEQIRKAMTEYEINTLEEIDKFMEAEKEAIKSGKDLSGALSIYENKMNALAAENKKTFKEMWEEASDDDKDKLLELAEAGKLTSEALDEIATGKSIGDALGTDKAVKEINKLVDGIKQISSMKSGISDIISTTQTKFENKDKNSLQYNKADSQKVESLGNNLGVSEWTDPKALKAWKEYKRLAGESTTTTEQMKEAQDKLATAYYNTNNFLAGLNESNKDSYIGYLNEMGVINADAVVHQKLINKKIELQLASMGMSEKIDVSRSAMNKLQKATGATRGEIIKYIQAAVQAGKATITTDGSISNLAKLYKALGLTSAQARQAAEDIANVAGGGGIATDKDGNTFTVAGMDPKARQWSANRSQKRLDNLETDLYVKLGGDDQSNNSSNSTTPSTKTDKTQKKEKQHIDWIERRITRINSLLSYTQSIVENIGKWTGKKLKLSDKNDEKRISSINKELNQEIKYYRTLYKMQGEAEREYTKKANASKTWYTGKGKKKKKHTIPKDIIKKIENGNYTNKDLKYWFGTYGEDMYNHIQDYIGYFDKAQSAKQGRQEALTQMREKKIEKHQNRVNLAEARISRDEAQESIAIGYKKQNAEVKEQLKNLQQSYKHQKKIAELNGDNAELDKLRAEYEQKRRELLYHEIENIKETFANKRSLVNNRIQDAENRISVAQARGSHVNIGWYQSKNLNEERNIAYYTKERKEILENLKGLKKYSEEWYKAKSDLQETENGIAESNKNIADNTHAMYDETHNLHVELREQNTRVADEAKFFANLSHEDNINSSGVQSGNYYGFTDTGKRRIAADQIGLVSAAKNIKDAKNLRDEYEGIYNTVKNMSEEEAQKYFKDNNINLTSIQDALEKKNALQQEYQDALQKEHDTWEDLRSIMQEYYDAQKQYLSEIIDARKRILDEEKDLYDYEKNINEKTKNIATLQKRLAAIQGDQSEAGKMRRQQIQSQLDEAQKDLQDTQYERWKTDQESMLDNLMTDYNKIVDDHMKNEKEWKDEIKDTIVAQAGSISSAFAQYSNNISTDLQGIINKYNVSQSDTKTDEEKYQTVSNNISSQLDTYNSNTQSAINNASTNQKNATVTPEDSDNKSNKLTASGLKKMLKEIDASKPKKGNMWYNSPLNILIRKITGDAYMLQSIDTAKKLYMKLTGQPGTNFDNLFNDKGKLYKLLKNAGFKTGGIGRLVKASGEDGFAMVRNGEGFVAPEHVNAVQQWMNQAPDMTQMLNTINKNGTGGDTTIGDMYFSLPNVTDPRSFIEAFQNSKDMQRLAKISFEDFAKNGNLSARIHSV